MPQWNELSKRLTRLARGDANEIQLGNVFLTLALVEKEEFDADAYSLNWTPSGIGCSVVTKTNGRRRDTRNARHWRDMSAPPRTH